MESDIGSMSLYLTVLICTIFAIALLSMSRVAITALSDSKVRRLSSEGDRTARLIERLIDNPVRFLATLQMSITLLGCFAAALSAIVFIDPLSRLMGVLPLSGAPIRVISLVVIVLLFSLIWLMVGEVIAVKVGARHSEAISAMSARPIWILCQIGRPLSALLRSTESLVLRLVGIGSDRDSEEVREEILVMIDDGMESGAIAESDKDMISNIFEFEDLTAADMMTHRTEIGGVELGASLDEVVRLATEGGYSRIPVYEDDIDSITGVLHIKDLLGFLNKDPSSFNISDYIRDPLYVLETTNSKTILESFRSQKIQMAIVVDEYGGTSGLVTMEDILESIVGNIQDEYDHDEEAKAISQIEENSYMMDGLTALDEVLEFFELELGDKYEVEFDTIGGFITNRIGFIPGEDQHPQIEVGNVLFTVTEMEERRIAKLRADVTPKESPPEDDLQD